MSLPSPETPVLPELLAAARLVDPPEETGWVEAGGGELHRLSSHTDDRGTLIVAQFDQALPFKPKRVFQVLHLPPDSVRGDHAHRRCQQFLVVTNGAATILVDNGRDPVLVRLDAPDLGLYVPPLNWSVQMDFAPNTHLVICASEPYDDSDYISDYATFVSLARA